ncbi:MAG: hypothetical protein D6710_08330 [Nitrospirae bacterium]|nr:MAG: hypothetical protein D6710_08330 [Nitrospirota bacterium]
MGLLEQTLEVTPTDDSVYESLKVYLAEKHIPIEDYLAQLTPEQIRALGFSFDELKVIWPKVPTKDQWLDVKIKSKDAHAYKNESTFINKANLERLKRAYNKHIYTSPTANDSGTLFRIGPLTYGDEVQSIRIIEDKAVQAIPGTRSGSDFLIDAGVGDADIHVSMIFSGRDHILKALRPLIALFKICPIVSVKNKVIKSALYNEFTENVKTPPTRQLLEAIEDSLNRSAEKKSEELSTNSSLQVGQEKDFGNALSPVDLLDERSKFDDPNQVSDAQTDVSKKIDRTGHVPVAMVSMEVSTHPELPDSLMVNLYLKRINVGNYLSNFLQYRAIDNTPTSDPREAFWLARAIDLYIDRVLPEDYIDGAIFGKVTFDYEGNNFELDQFKSASELKKFDINDPLQDSVVTQIAYTMSNKFAFHRLIGESYPTAQHIGLTSGTISLSVRTVTDSSFERIHTFKSAADFFVRHTDRIDRYNGWEIDSIITRLFASSPDGQKIKDQDSTINRSYYPMKVVSSTVDDNPGVRDINIILRETNPDFFSDFGFSVKSGGYNANLLYDFYKEIFRRADVYRTSQDRQSLGSEYSLAFSIVYGDGDEDIWLQLVNSETIVAAMFERLVFNTDGSYDVDPGFAGKLIQYIQNDKQLYELLTGSRVSEFGGTITDNIRSVLEIGWFSNLSLKNTSTDDQGKSIAEAIVDEFFVISSGEVEETRKDLINHVALMLDERGRKELYKYIFTHTNISFTQNFIERLFVSITKRPKPPISDRIYDRIGLIKAYEALTLALEARGHEFLDEDSMAPLGKRGVIEDKIVIGSDGKIKKGEELISNYPDHFSLTYEELFNLADPDSGQVDELNWLQYAPSYQDFGIINNSVEDLGGVFNSSAVNRAQSKKAVTKKTPVPPSIFFWREPELSDFRNNIENEFEEWFDKLGSMVLPLSFDISEKEISNLTGLLTGKTKLAIGDIDDLQSLLHKVVKKQASKDPESIRQLAFSIANEEILYKEKTSNNILDLARGIGSGKNLDQEFYDNISWFSKASDTGFSVPILLASNKNAPVSRYVKISGVAGQTLARVIIEEAIGTSDPRNEVFQNFIDTTIVRNASGTSPIRLSTATPEEGKASMLKISQALPDNGNDMIRAFPVMRLYLIDERGPSVIVQDNFFGYNAIQSIDITLDKNDADLAVIRVADPFHILQGQTFGVSSSNSNVVDDIVFADNKYYDADILERMKLKQGRPIQIRAGYSASPEHLDIIFTGRITEIEFGDVVTIIAQSWKAELIGRQVEFELNDLDNTSVKDLVVRTIRDADPAGMGETYSYEDAKALSKSKFNIGSADVFKKSRITGQGTYGGASGAPGVSFAPFGFNLIENLFQGVDTRLKNIWVADTEHERWGIIYDSITAGWNASRWVVPLTPAWDILQDATNYVWGYVCQVVPYDGKSTLFFGRPDQMYFYTEGVSKRNREFRDARALSIQEISKDMASVVFGFVESEYFKGSTAELLVSPSVVGITETNGVSDYFNSDIVADIRYDTGGVERNKTLPARYRSYIEYKVLDSKNVFFSNEDVGFSSSTIIQKKHSLGYNPSLINKNYRRSFEQEFNNIVETLGNRKTAAILVFCSFYGLSPSIVQLLLPNVGAIVSELMLPLDETGLDLLRSSFTEAFGDIDIFKATDLSSEQEDKKDLLLSVLESPVWSNTGKGFPKGVFYTTDVNNNSVYYYSNKSINNTIVHTLNQSRISFGPVDLSGIQVVHVSSLPDGREYGFIPEHQAKELLDKGLIFEVPAAISSKVANFESYKRARKDIFGESVISEAFSIIAKKLGNGYILDELKQGRGSKDFASTIVDNLYIFRAFVYYLSQYMRSVVSSGADEIKNRIEDIKNNLVFDFGAAANMKVFRDYHYITNDRDILSNDLAVTTREMHNTVVVRYPEEIVTNNDISFIPTFVEKWIRSDHKSATITSEVQWLTFPDPTDGHIGLQFDDSVTLQDKKIGVHTDINVTRREQAAKVATNVLTKMMRPMYRNSITILGRHIKPWDYVYLNDKYTDMLGMLDVERVVHHYDAQTGWVTRIVPHLACEANPGNRAIQAAVIASKFDRVFDILDYALWTSAVLAAIPTGGASVGVASVAHNEILKRFGSEALRRLARRKAKDLSMAAALETLKKSAVVGATNLISNYIKYSFAVTSLGTISRLLVKNARAGIDQLPVIMMPILYKGVPLEAGTKGTELSYWSLGSKFHWALRHIKNGILDLFSAFTPETEQGKFLKRLSDTEE